jgi:GNAT superfamily N-acetyltransferase
MPNVVVRPLTSERWSDVEAVFNARGCSEARGCWCMFYRNSGAHAPLPAGVSRSAANRAAFKALVDAGVSTGLIGYRGRQPVGWVSLGPRGDYAKLARSPVMKPVDETPVWSIVCFVVPAEQRGRGIAKALLGGAVGWAKRRGVQVLEAYPVDRAERSRDAAMWFGAKSMYDAAGFVEVVRRKPDRPVMRLTVR